MQIGIVGLGKMGLRIARKLVNGGHDVLAWNRSKVQSPTFKVQSSIKALVQKLSKPRVVWIMVPAGEATDEVLAEVSKFVQKGDIVIDGGNAFYKDTEKRYQNFKKRGVKFLGIGVSGGVLGEERGFSLMVGGDKDAYGSISPLLDCLSQPNGSYDYFGEGGAGHFVKMVHNGIEYGMMQSIGEGFEVLKKSPYKLDLLKVAKTWQKGTIISGFLIDRTTDVLSQDSELKSVRGVIEATGEAEWTVQTAKEEGVPVEIIERSLNYRRRSKTDEKIQNSFTAKMVASLRNAFGGHSVRHTSVPVRLRSLQALSTRAEDKEVKKK